MKFLFYPQGCLPVHGTTVEERPLGGTEAGLILLSRALARVGHSVTVMTGAPNPPLTNPLFLPYSALGDVGPVDVLVAVREWMPILLPIEAKRRLFWTGDSYDQPQNLGLGDRRVAARVDAFLAVSEWHKATICRASRFPEAKAWVIRNGISPEHFRGEEARSRKRLIYSSTPYRGLALLPSIWPLILARHPEAELHIFSGYEVYGGGASYPPHVLREYEHVTQTLRALPRCVVHGNVRQKELAREFMKSSVLCYPNTFEETSCITALEAQAAGCAIVTSALGALPETVGDAGILIGERPGTPEYQRAFVEATNRLLEDDLLFEQLSAAGKRRAQESSWDHVAQRLLRFLGAA
ncbi:MAG: glycosyltransferase family 4 protein [Deltaproteobacteria bacterium]|nr:glycosyltransferase family 4 protein [Deltaproteobacteria bacterium]